MSFPQSNRLRLAGDFRSVFRTQQRFIEGKLLLKAKKLQKPPSRFGIVIGKTVSKKAVERNRMRRLLKEALKAQYDSLGAPHDIVLVALPGFSLNNIEEAKDIVEKLFLKASLKTSS